jgi:hypothetical protein
MRGIILIAFRLGKLNPPGARARSFVLTATHIPLSLRGMNPNRRSPARLFPAAVLAAFSLAAGLRAQVTEVPQTIEPGHVLMRMDAISFGLQPEAAAPNEYRALALGTAIVSAGITDTFDFEAGAQLFLRDTFTSSGSDHTDSGIGDIQLRVKWTFWSDPSTGQAAAVIPYILVPTNSSAVGNDSTQGGIIIPWSFHTGVGLKAGAMVEVDELRNEANTRYDTRWYGSTYAQWELAHAVSVYGEATASATTEGSSTYTGTLGAGATLSVSSNFQWDFEMSRVLGPGRNQWTQVLRFRWRLL